MKFVFQMQPAAQSTNGGKASAGRDNRVIAASRGFALLVLGLYRSFNASLNMLKEEVWGVGIVMIASKMKTANPSTRCVIQHATAGNRRAVFSHLFLAASILLLLAAVPSEIRAQTGYPISGQALTPTGTPAAGALLYVCPYTAVGSPCYPQASIYSDSGLTQPLTQPYATNQYGSYNVWVAAGTYLVQIVVNQTVTYANYVTAAGGSGTVTGQIQYCGALNTNGVSTSINASLHLCEVGSVDIFSQPVTGPQISGSFNGQQYPGSDAGAQLNAATAALPIWSGTNGAAGQVVWPSTAAGSDGTTPLVTGYKVLNNSVSNFQGSPFRFSPTTGASFLFGPPSSAGYAGGGIGRTVGENFSLIEGNNDHPNTYAVNTAVGLSIGGGINGVNASGYAANLGMHDFAVFGYNTAIQRGNNSFLDQFSNCLFNHNYYVVNELGPAINEGENLSFSQCMINSNYGPGFNLSDIRAEWNLVNSSIDDSNRTGDPGHENSVVESTTGSVTSGSPVLTVASGTGVVKGQLISMAGVPAGTQVLSGDGSTTITMTANATTNESSQPVNFIFYGSDASANIRGYTVDVTFNEGHMETYGNQQIYLGGGVAGLDVQGYPVVVTSQRFASFGTHFYDNARSIPIYFTGCAADGAGNVTFNLQNSVTNNASYSVNNNDSLLISGFSGACTALNGVALKVTSQPTQAGGWTTMIAANPAFTNTISTSSDTGQGWDAGTTVSASKVIQVGGEYYAIFTVPFQSFTQGGQITPAGLSNASILNGKTLTYQFGLLSQSQCYGISATCVASDVTQVPGITAISSGSESGASLIATPDPGMITVKDTTAAGSAIAVVGANINGTATQNMFNLSQAHKPAMFLAANRNQNQQWISSGITTLAGLDSYADRGALYSASPYPATFDSGLAVNSNNFGSLKVWNGTTANAANVQAYQPNLAAATWSMTYQGGIDSTHGYDDFGIGVYKPSSGDNLAGIFTMNAATIPVMQWDLVNGATKFNYPVTFAGGTSNASSVWASIPACSSSTPYQSVNVSDVGDSGSSWKCLLDSYTGAYAWKPDNGFVAFTRQVVPVIVVSSGSYANNGVLSGITALDQTYSGGAYVCVPADAIDGANPAACYYHIFSSTTGGTAYNNRLFETVARLSNAAAAGLTYQWVSDGATAADCITGGGSNVNLCHYVSGVWSISAFAPPTIAPPTPTAFSSSGPGAFTQSTSNVYLLGATTIQGGVMGTRGQLDGTWEWITGGSNNSNQTGWYTWGTNLTTASPAFVGTTINPTTNSGYAQVFRIKNLGTASLQRLLATTTGAGASGFSNKSVNTAATTTLLFSGQVTGSAANWIELTGFTLTMTRP